MIIFIICRALPERRHLIIRLLRQFLDSSAVSAALLWLGDIGQAVDSEQDLISQSEELGDL
ncbi:MAG: hypothetical protein ACLQUY_26885 [Ktedonobacterales bacterium]